MIVVDTNIVLRYLLNDHEELSGKARELILSDDVLVLTQVLAETIYVLGSVYRSGREEISDTLLTFCSMDNVLLENKEVVIGAIEEFKTSSLDFVDVLLFSYCRITGEKVVTFDKKLLNMLETLNSGDDR